MPGRRVEERVKSNETRKETGGSQQPSKGRAQERGHGRHTASTTPHRSTREGSTRGTREKRHRAPRHAPHRHHTHRTHQHPRTQHVVSEPRQPAQRAGSWQRRSVRPQTPLRTADSNPPGDALPPPPPRATPARKGARRGVGAGSPHPHRPHPGRTGRRTLAARSRGRAAGGGIAPDTRRPS